MLYKVWHSPVKLLTLEHSLWPLVSGRPREEVKAAGQVPAGVGVAFAEMGSPGGGLVGGERMRDSVLYRSLGAFLVQMELSGRQCLFEDPTAWSRKTGPAVMIR